MNLFIYFSLSQCQYVALRCGWFSAISG